ncbi:MAG: cation transporter [Holophagaceae bacterium]|nr:cation transporter [Holophagaceae bacterium]
MQTNFTVTGMSCYRCKKAIEKALSAIAGVAKVAVDLVAGSVVVTHDNSVTVETIREQIEMLGFIVAT